MLKEENRMESLESEVERRGGRHGVEVVLLVVRRMREGQMPEEQSTNNQIQKRISLFGKLFNEMAVYSGNLEARLQTKEEENERLWKELKEIRSVRSVEDNDEW
ncbi:hypothetical protein TKK_0016610 [Trichogramma kaykai]